MKTPILKAMLAVAVLAALPMLRAEDGKSVVSHDGSCQVTVPDNWTSTLGFGIASAPDKSMDVALSSPKGTTTVAGVKQMVPSIYPKDKIVKDSATVFQMEGEGGRGKPNIYRAIQIPGKVCILEVTFEEGTIDQARKIAETMKAK